MSNRFACLLGLIWLCGIVVGTRELLAHEYTAGTHLRAPAVRPGQSHLPSQAGLPTLILFAHPKCPCTRTSLEELERLMARCQGRVNAQVVFFQPPGQRAEWTRTDQWRQAESIPGVTAFADSETWESRCYRVSTSGHVLLYDASQHLQFSGGITESRSHVGNNLGETTVLALILHPREATTGMQTTPVFGCSLLNPPSLPLSLSP